MRIPIQTFLILWVTAISAAFVAMIRASLLTILLAAISRVYQCLLGRLRGRKGIAAIATTVLSGSQPAGLAAHDPDRRAPVVTD